MKKIIIISIILIIAMAFGAYVFTGSSSDTSQSSTEMTDKQSELVKKYSNLEGANIGKTVKAQGQSEVTININEFLYETAVLEIDVGTVVTWVNQGDIRHDVTTAKDSEIQGVNSELLHNGESFTYEFDEKGMFNYFCSPHPFQMRGVVVVK